MCGLFGMACKKGSNPQDGFALSLMRELGTVSTLRGIDSTGIAISRTSGRKKFHTSVSKAVISAPDFFDQTHVRNMFYGAGFVNSVIGHCRAATEGEVNYENAHPYFFNEIIGAHNGTIKCLSVEAAKRKTTDSRILFERIYEEGIDEALNSLTGLPAYALSFIYNGEPKVYFVRNKERTLYYMKSKCGNFVLWASERSFLAFINLRTKTEWHSPELFDTDKLYTLDTTTNEFSIRPIDKKPATIIIKPREDTKKEDNPFIGNSEKNTKDGGMKGSALIPEPSIKDNFSWERSRDNTSFFYRDYFGGFISLPEAIRKLSKGCGNCGTVTSTKEPAHFFDVDNYLCDECLGTAINNSWVTGSSIVECKEIND